jgi:hypothetical protein
MAFKMILKFDKSYFFKDLDKFTDVEEFTNYNDILVLVVTGQHYTIVDKYYLDRNIGLFNNIRNIFIENNYIKNNYKFHILQTTNY